MATNRGGRCYTKVCNGLHIREHQRRR